MGSRQGSRRGTAGLVRLAFSVTVLLGLAATTLLTVSSRPAGAATGSVAVFVGYADGTRAPAAPSRFPVPWAGSPSVAFEGCQPATGCVYDAGAVMVRNVSGAPVTVNSIAVHVSTCTYAGSATQWPSVVLLPGRSVIVTQLGTGSPFLGQLGCTGPSPRYMDTSEVGPGGADIQGRCTQDGIKPTVDVTVNGVKATYTDSGQVLNTFGVDLGGCRQGANESIPWTPIGQQAGRYAALGDSFSSGEGVPPYVLPSNTNLNRCHDSTRAYPVSVATTFGYATPPLPNTNLTHFLFWACSGAIVADVSGTAGGGVGSIGGVGQWTRPPQLSGIDDHTTLVTISIGGNDAGFGPVASSCIQNQATCAAQVGAGSNWANMLARLNGSAGPNGYERIVVNGTTVDGPFACSPPACNLGTSTSGGTTTYVIKAPRLRDLYNQIAARAAPNAKVKVVLYPPILNPAGVAPGLAFCNIPVIAGATNLPNWALADQELTPATVASLNGAETALNNLIRAEVAATANPNIIAVDPAPQWSPPANGGRGGWFCNGTALTTIRRTPYASSVTPFINPIIVDSVSVTSSGREVITDPGSIHPNAAGHAATATAVVKADP